MLVRDKKVTQVIRNDLSGFNAEIAKDRRPQVFLTEPENREHISAAIRSYGGHVLLAIVARTD